MRGLLDESLSLLLSIETAEHAVHRLNGFLSFVMSDERMLLLQRLEYEHIIFPYFFTSLERSRKAFFT